MSNNELNSPVAQMVHAYAEGKQAWRRQKPREAPHRLARDLKLKWLEGYDQARTESYHGEGRQA